MFYHLNNIIGDWEKGSSPPFFREKGPKMAKKGQKSGFWGGVQKGPKMCQNGQNRYNVKNVIF
jgi:uncharacterized protein YjaZ